MPLTQDYTGPFLGNWKPFQGSELGTGMKNLYFRTVNTVEGKHVVKARGIGDRKTSLKGVDGV